MHTFIRALVLTVGLLSTAPAAAQPPTAQEATMIAIVTAEHERSVALLERLVAVNSGSMNLQGVEEVGRILRAEFELLGFQVRWVPMAETGRAGHLIATHRGAGRGKRLLLIGHLDTVFEPDSPFQDWKRTGDFAEGPGVVDMKGGDVIMIAALRAMHAAGTLTGADITVVLTGDEEKVGSPVAIARRDLIAAGRASDIALDFENLAREDGQDIGSIARRSSHNWTLRVRARSGHSSGVCRESCGATYELGRIIEAFRNELPEPNATVSVAMIAGGAQAAANDAATAVSATGKTNIIPAEAVAIGDIRTLSNEQEERVRARMQAIVARPLPQAQALLEFSEGGYPPMAPTEGNRALLRKLNEVNANARPAGDAGGRSRQARRGRHRLRLVHRRTGGTGHGGDREPRARREGRFEEHRCPGPARCAADVAAREGAAPQALTAFAARIVYARASEPSRRRQARLQLRFALSRSLITDLDGRSVSGKARLKRLPAPLRLSHIHISALSSLTAFVIKKSAWNASPRPLAGRGRGWGCCLGVGRLR